MNLLYHALKPRNEHVAASVGAGAFRIAVTWPSLGCKPSGESVAQECQCSLTEEAFFLVELQTCFLDTLHYSFQVRVMFFL